MVLVFFLSVTNKNLKMEGKISCRKIEPLTSKKYKRHHEPLDYALFTRTFHINSYMYVYL